MITTTQVRAIINKHAPNSYGVYTNKTKGHLGQVRRVKCYFRNNIKLLKALQRAAGRDNVTLTVGGVGAYGGQPGITVKCVLG